MIKTIISFLKYPENRAVGFCFLAIALGFGAWVTRLPEIKASLAISEAELGTALFFMPLGLVSLMPFYSKIINKLGERKTIVISLIFFLLCIIWMSVVSSHIELMVSLYLMGLGLGLTDVSMNAVAVETEKQKGRVIMSACHGFFSVGGMFGAFMAAGFITFNVALWVQSVIISILLFVLLLIVKKHLVETHEKVESKGFQLPQKRVLILAVICFCIFMSEGGITDWSTIYLRDTLIASGQLSGFGFAGFSLLMAIGRFNGDNWILKFGAKKLVVAGAFLAIAGLGLTIVKDVYLAILGFSLAGFGYSVIVPTMFSASARVDGVPPNQGIASVASAGYVGLLVGPVLIGFIAEGYGLANGFFFLLLLTATSLLLSMKALK